MQIYKLERDVKKIADWILTFQDYLSVPPSRRSHLHHSRSLKSCM